MMDRDVLDLHAETKHVAPEYPFVPPGPSSEFPGNYNSMDPRHLDSLLWSPISDLFGFDARTYMADLNGTDLLGMSLALQCADIIGKDLAKAEMVLWKEGEPDQYAKLRAKDHWLARMLARRPNPFHTWTELWRMVGTHLALAQNAYLVMTMLRNGRVTEMLPLPPGSTRAVVADNGRLYYDTVLSTPYLCTLMGQPLSMQGQAIRLPEDRVIHLRGRMWNGLNGMSNADLGNPIFRLLKAVGDYQHNQFSRQGQILMAFEMEDSFSGEQAEASFQRLKRQLEDRVNSGKPLVLEGGLKAKVLASAAKDTLPNEAFKDLVQRICGLMMLPPHKLMAYDSVKYDNMASSNILYADDVLVPMAKNIEDNFRLKVLAEEELDEIWPEFHRMSLMAGDMQTLGKLVHSSWTSGLMTQNEGRVILPLGLNPTKHGDRFMIPVNTALIDEKTGEAVVLAANGQAQGDTAAPAAGDQPAKEAADGLRLVHSRSPLDG